VRGVADEAALTPERADDALARRLELRDDGRELLGRARRRRPASLTAAPVQVGDP
jgi:hypothetical protein